MSLELSQNETEIRGFDSFLTQSQHFFETNADVGLDGDFFSPGTTALLSEFTVLDFPAEYVHVLNGNASPSDAFGRSFSAASVTSSVPSISQFQSDEFAMSMMLQSQVHTLQQTPQQTPSQSLIDGIQWLEDSGSYRFGTLGNVSFSGTDEMNTEALNWITSPEPPLVAASAAPSPPIRIQTTLAPASTATAAEAVATASEAADGQNGDGKDDDETDIELSPPIAPRMALSSRKQTTSARKLRGSPGSPAQKIFVCPYDGCNKTFPRAYNLKSHLFCHTGQRPHSCLLCDVAFARKHDLQRHVRTLHSAKRPFKCKNCMQAFSQEDQLRRHMIQENSAATKFSSLPSANSSPSGLIASPASQGSDNLSAKKKRSKPKSRANAIDDDESSDYHA